MVCPMICLILDEMKCDSNTEKPKVRKFAENNATEQKPKLTCRIPGGTKGLEAPDMRGWGEEQRCRGKGRKLVMELWTQAPAISHTNAARLPG